ncbi:thiamine diphosphokinase [Cohnella sp.]|uniref:thiamine diphosphokinase n=1 Tax=Cohnella sp. TaxID=1883426 RepID=UPI00356406C4
MSSQPETRALIFTGGNLGLWAFTYLKSNDYLIGADRGAEFLIRNGYPLHLALGDFDSVFPDQLQRIADTAIELITCDPIHKDWTDTELALREAMTRGYREILILGALGTRFDHGLANVHLLRQAAQHGCELTLIDENNIISLCIDRFHLKAHAEFPYTSLLPITPEVTGVTLEGFRYPLYDATLKLGYSIGISNVLDAPTGLITVTSGMLLVIRSRD